MIIPIFVLSVFIKICSFPAVTSQTIDCINTCIGPQLQAFLISKNSGSYQSLSTGNRARVPRYPLAIFLAQVKSDIKVALTCGRTCGAPVVVRAGGHSYEDLSSMSNSLIIDISNVNAVSVFQNGTSYLANIDGGARLGHVYLSLWDAGGWSISAGLCPSVGVGGHISGGGKGMQSRKYGLASDQVVSMNVLLANGDEVVANSNSHSDLFWALRGGGAGSFGIVTQYTVKVFQMPINSMFRLHFLAAPEVVTAWQTYFPTAPNELGTQLTIANGQIELLGHYLGTMNDLKALLATSGMLSLASFQYSIYKSCSGIGVRLFLWFDNSCSQTDLLTQLPSSKDYGKSKSDYVSNPLPTFAVQQILNQMAMMYGAYFQMEAGGGFFDTIGSTDTPYPQRAGSLFVMQYYVPLGQNEQSTSWNYIWLNQLESILRPYVNGFKYQNYPDLDLGADYGVRYYGAANFQRLQQIKAIYDPTNYFTNDQSIPPVVIAPLILPTVVPSVNPTTLRTALPSAVPSQYPTTLSIILPSAVPSVNPTTFRTVLPSAVSSVNPTTLQTALPSAVSSVNPSTLPTILPSAVPSVNPAALPTVLPFSVSYQNQSTISITISSTVSSVNPSILPTNLPSTVSSLNPTSLPSSFLFVESSLLPTIRPSAILSRNPSTPPSVIPATTFDSSIPSLRSSSPSISAIPTLSLSSSILPTLKSTTIINQTINPTTTNPSTPSPSINPSKVPTAIPVTNSPSKSPSSFPPPSSAPSQKVALLPPICLYSSRCSLTVPDCVAGTICQGNQYYTQCVPDMSYSTAAYQAATKCIPNYQPGCVASAQCCNPGFVCSSNLSCVPQSPPSCRAQY